MRALLLLAALVGCSADDAAPCPLDPFSSVRRCAATLDLSLPIETTCPRSYYDLTNDPPPCDPGLICDYDRDDGGIAHRQCACSDDGKWRCLD